MTPLKKRRLARESISMETPPYPPTPSTPTPSGGDIAGLLSESEKSSLDDSLENTRVKDENGQSHVINGFKAHLSPITPNTPTDHLFEVRLELVRLSL